jgi:hypothetical protein
MVSLSEAPKIVRFTGAVRGVRSPVHAPGRTAAWARSLFRTSQPRKACVEDGDAFCGGWRGCRAWRDGFGWRREKCTQSPLVAAVRSAATRSQAA